MDIQKRRCLAFFTATFSKLLLPCALVNGSCVERKTLSDDVVC